MKPLDRDTLIRLADIKRENELLQQRLENPAAWAVGAAGWRDSCAPEIVALYDEVSREVLLRLEAFPSKASHPRLLDFVKSVAKHSAVLAAFGAGAEPDFDNWYGWEERFKAAIRSVGDLSHTLAAMHNGERQHWLPPRYVAGQAGAGSDVDLQAKAFDEWLSMTHAIAEYFDTARQRMDSKSKVSEALSSHVWKLAALWAEHFDELPGAAEESPFTKVVQAYIVALYPASKPPSHPSIAGALRNWPGLSTAD